VYNPIFNRFRLIYPCESDIRTDGRTGDSIASEAYCMLYYGAVR